MEKAPYWRFRSTPDAYAADIMGCNWTCDGCWSKFGWLTVPPRFELSAREVAERLRVGMEATGRDTAVLTGGEPALYWPHVHDLVAEFLGGPGQLVIETSGVLLERKQLRALKDLEPPWNRLKLVIGLKATQPEWLAELTGLSLGEAEEAHEHQLEVAIAAARMGLNVRATVIDKYADQGAIAAIVNEGVDVTALKWQRYGNTHRFYTPPRHRKETDGTRT